MDALYEVQVSILNKIRNSFVNFKKTGASKMTLGQTKARMAQMRENYHQAQKNDATFLKLEGVSHTHDYFKQSIFSLIEESFYSVLGEYEDHLCLLRNETQTTPPSPHEHHGTTGAFPYTGLPQVQLPMFSGLYEEWSSFRDHFRAMVHNKTELSLVLKHHYLKARVQGEAADLIKNIPLTAENYQLAWTRLTTHYDNNRRLVSGHVNRLINASPMKNGSAPELKRIVKEAIGSYDALVTMNRNLGDGDLVVGLIANKFDFNTSKDWQKHLGSNTDPPTVDQLKSFLSTQILTIESYTRKPIQPSTPSSGGAQRSSNNSTAQSGGTQNQAAHQTNSTTISCKYCKKSHNIRDCEGFSRLDWTGKKDFVTKSNLCFNCLGPHSVKQCTSKRTCSVCKRKHHTLLHKEAAPKLDSDNGGDDDKTKGSPLQGGSKGAIMATQTTDLSNQTSRQHSVLLATARVYLTSNSGHKCIVRALVDPCSQSSLISKSLADILHLRRTKVNISLTGVGGKLLAQAKHSVDVRVSPHFKSTISLDVSALVVPKVSTYRPPIFSSKFKIPKAMNLELADPQYFESDSIDLLLDAAVYSQIVMGEILKLGPGKPLASKTSLGWLLSGAIDNSTDNPKLHSANVFHVCEESLLSEQLQRFWEVESVPTRAQELSSDEIACENYFSKTHSRDLDGRFSVRLPFKTDQDHKLRLYHAQRASYNLAKNMLLQLEKRFNKNTTLHREYVKFIEEYQSLGHLSLAPLNQDISWFLPHHGVVKESSTTTKLRVVFNGSAVAQGVDLNSCLLPGQNLLPNLYDLILKWREYEFCFTADAEKMFRQINVDLSDRPFQTILWRDSPESEIKAYHLNTVTYGMVCAPYLACRVLRQLSNLYADTWPLGSEVLKYEVYMDDFLSGAHTKDEASQKVDQLKEITKNGCFPLHKWSSNCPEVLSSVPPEDRSFDPLSLSDLEPITSILGLNWNSSSDVFFFKINVSENQTQWTKRRLLSQIAKIFDPSGWLAPVIIKAKILMQQTWLLKLDWDDELPRDMVIVWEQWLSEAPQLSKIRIPRWNHYCLEFEQMELHGFADASKEAYAAAIYLRVQTTTNVFVCLLTAKTKVAPIKTISIPRLELCATHLLAKIINYYRTHISPRQFTTHMWTDSKVVLHWLSDIPSRWPTFVANRCSEIQLLTPDTKWHHIPSRSNPVDMASRGLFPSQLIDSKLWFEGPEILHSRDPTYPSVTADDLKVPDPESPVSSLATSVKVVPWDLYFKYSSWSKLLRVTAFVLRFVYKVVHKTKSVSPKLEENSIKIDNHYRTILTSQSLPFLSLNFVIKSTELNLHTSEIDNARFLWVRIHQQYHFPREISQLKTNSENVSELQAQFSRDSPLMNLNPIYLNGLMRVGGRLNNALILDESRNPLILHSDDHITELIVRQHHMINLHGGAQLTLASVRRLYWIVRGRQVVRSVIGKCLTCRRYSAQREIQMMGDLPQVRVTPDVAFTHTGVDYAGPYFLRLSKTRGGKTQKGYVVVFVCMATKAVHLEVAEDYTSEAFIAAFKRFDARRGPCTDLYSDQGTNFIGASSELKQQLSEFLSSGPFHAQLLQFNTNWHWNPPAAPHFGGLWEAAVKSLKYHLKRSIGDQVLTFVEMSTLLTQIEACLNSRPIVPLTDDPSDLDTLTPSHFLKGKPSRVLPEGELEVSQLSPLRRWKQITFNLQGFWRRWSDEYVSSLQARQKWLSKNLSIKVGDLVLIRQENYPPGHWPLGRIIELLPGRDGLVRVVKVRTATSEYTRPISKIVILIRDDALRQAED